MTTEEREMLLEMPAVQELLREEREACALLVEEWVEDTVTDSRTGIVHKIRLPRSHKKAAAAIRARKTNR